MLSSPVGSFLNSYMIMVNVKCFADSILPESRTITFFFDFTMFTRFASSQYITELRVPPFFFSCPLFVFSLMTCYSNYNVRTAHA